MRRSVSRPLPPAQFARDFGAYPARGAPIGALTIWRVQIAIILALLLLPLSARAEVAESRLVYVYITACESCARAAAVVDQLPAFIDLPTGEKTRVTVDRINLIDDVARVEALFEACGVPEDARVAPAVFIGTDCLIGADAIEGQLAAYLAEGRGLAETPAAKGVSRETGLLGAIAAGFVGGLNPCALSMLILFLTTVLSVRARPARYAAAFLASKFACYLLIGSVLLGLMRAWNPAWLPLAARIALTAMAILLAAVNLADAWNARMERYGKIRNQLPTGMRKFIHNRIGNLQRRGTRFLMAAAVFTGIVVALSEFMCAGQIYLAVILSALQIRENMGYWMLLLAGFCAGFLAPSAVLSALIVAGRSAFRVGDWLRRRMPLIKLLSALLPIGIAAAMWALS